MTEPVENILPRKNDSELQQALDYFSDSLDEVVNYGTHILLWDTQKNHEGDYILPAALFMRNFIEEVDAISILIRNGSIDSAKSLLRTAIENFFYIEYLLQDNTKKRSMSFLVWDNLTQISVLNSYNPNTSLGKQFISKMKKDKLLSNLKLTEEPKFKEILEKKDKLLNSYEYRETKKEYYNTKRKNGNKKPKWYSLYNGPKSLESLAENIGYLGIYETYYRSHSRATHGNDIIQGRITMSESGIGQVYQIRFPGDAQGLTHETISIALQLYNTFCTGRTPEKEKEFKKWYKDILEILQTVGRMQIVIK